MIAARLVRLAAALVLVTACLAWAAPPARAQGGDVALILRAAWGAQRLDALQKIHTLRLHGVVTVAGIPGTADNWKDVRDGRYAVYADSGAISGAQGFDGAHAWHRDPRGLVSDDGSVQAHYVALDHAYLNRYLLWTPGHGGATVTSNGQKVVNGRRYDTLQITPPGSLPFELWIDAVSHLPARTIVTVGMSSAVTTFSDYRSVKELLVPFAQQTTFKGEVSTFVVTHVDVDDPGAAAALERPASNIAALPEPDSV
jgi:hypothetical protein